VIFIDNRLVTPKNSIVFRKETDEWALLFDPDTGNTFGLNLTGAYIWTLLDGVKSSNDIALHLSQNFDTGGVIPKNDVDDFLNELEKKGFIKFSNSDLNGQ